MTQPMPEKEKTFSPATLKNLIIYKINNQLRNHPQLIDLLVVRKSVNLFHITKTLKEDILSNFRLRTYRAPGTLIQCELCLRCMEKEGDLKIHLRQKHGIYFCAPYRCRRCYLPFMSQWQTENHMVRCNRIFFSDIPIKYHCPICPERFYHGSDFAVHLRCVHKY